MSYTIDVNVLLREIKQSIREIDKDLNSFKDMKLPPGVTEGIKWWTLMGVKMALSQLEGSIERAKVVIEEHKDVLNKVERTSSKRAAESS